MRGGVSFTFELVFRLSYPFHVLQLLSLEEPWTLILDDALANSFIAPVTEDIKDDHQLTCKFWFIEIFVYSVNTIYLVPTVNILPILGLHLGWIILLSKGGIFFIVHGSSSKPFFLKFFLIDNEKFY